MPAIATVVNFGVSFFHRKDTENTENAGKTLKKQCKRSKNTENTEYAGNQKKLKNRKNTTTLKAQTKNKK